MRCTHIHTDAKGIALWCCFHTRLNHLQSSHPQQTPPVLQNWNQIFPACTNLLPAYQQILPAYCTRKNSFDRRDSTPSLFHPKPHSSMLSFATWDVGLKLLRQRRFQNKWAPHILGFLSFVWTEPCRASVKSAELLSLGRPWVWDRQHCPDL